MGNHARDDFVGARLDELNEPAGQHTFIVAKAPPEDRMFSSTRGATISVMINAFIATPAAPSDADLAAALGSVHALWERLRAAVALPGEWHSYSKKAGWSMRLKSGDRNVVYLIPGKGAFDVSFALGDRAVAAAREAGLAHLVDGAKRYAEGTAVRFTVAKVKDIATVEKLVRIKLDH